MMNIKIILVIALLFLFAENGAPAVVPYMWLEDADGNQINGECKIAGREGSHQLIHYSHALTIPSDPITGRPSGSRRHAPLEVTKYTNQASPIIAQKVATGAALREVLLKFYQIDETGQEVEFFNIKLENVRITAFETEFLPYTEQDPDYVRGYVERLEFVYQKITWICLDGGIEYTDEWRGFDTGSLSKESNDNFSLQARNYPNPFNNSTTITVQIPPDYTASTLNVIIYDMTGRLVTTLNNSVSEEIQQNVVWQGTDNAGMPVSAGVYFYHVRLGDAVKCGRMVMIK
jgi:type VI secretion system secreted protein Hcp